MKHKSIEDFLQYYHKKYAQAGYTSGVPAVYQQYAKRTKLEGFSPDENLQSLQRKAPGYDSYATYKNPETGSEYVAGLNNRQDIVNAWDQDLTGPEPTSAQWDQSELGIAGEATSLDIQPIDPSSGDTSTAGGVVKTGSPASGGPSPAMGIAGVASAAMKTIGGLMNGVVGLSPAISKLIPNQEDERTIRPKERRAYNPYAQGQLGVYKKGGTISNYNTYNKRRSGAPIVIPKYQLGGKVPNRKELIPFKTEKEAADFATGGWKKYNKGGDVINPYSVSPNSKFKVEYDWGSVAPVTEPIQQITPIQKPSVAFDNYVAAPIERVTQTVYDQSWNPISQTKIPQPQREVFVPNYSDASYNIDRQLSQLYPSNQYLIGDAFLPERPRRNFIQRLFKSENGTSIPYPTITLDNNGIPLEIPYITAESGIHIKDSKKGTFTKAAKDRGLSVSQFENKVLSNPDNYSAAMRKKAQFSRNARSWSKAESGYTIGQEYELTPEEINHLIQLGYEIEY